MRVRLHLSWAKLILPSAAILASHAAQSGELTLMITLPEIAQAPYYRPYLAAWIEEPQTRAARQTLGVWYDTKLRNDLGKTFLPDLRSWWRALGESETLEADALSGPTRAPGTHHMRWDGDALIADLGVGDYVMAVEVVREKGQRELLRLPFTLGAASEAEATGRLEIGRIRVTVSP